MFAQRPSFRFLATGAAASLFVLTFLLLSARQSGEFTRYSLKTVRPDITSQCPTAEPTSPLNNTWEFLVQRDGQNYGLSEEQCRTAFPKLFLEIDKSALLRQEARITYKELDSRNVEDGMVRGIIDQGEVSNRIVDNIVIPLEQG